MRTLKLLLPLVALCPADTVILTNSDRLTGEIQKLEGDRLSLKTSYAGTVAIDWNMVESMTADEQFLVEAENQRRLTGRIQVSSGVVEVITEDEAVTMSPLSVVALERAPEGKQDGFWQRLGGNLDLGYSLTRGNSELNQSSLAFGGRYRAPSYQVQGEAASLFARQSDALSTSKHNGSLRLDRFVGSEAFVFALTGVERDERQLLNLRSNLGGGMGWKMIKTAATEFSLLAGATFVNENFRRLDPEDPERGGPSGEGLIGYSLEKAAIGRMALTSKLSAFRNFLGPGRYRITFDGGVRLPIVSRFTWSVRLFDRFDSRPPLDVERNDYGLISSFGLVF